MKFSDCYFFIVSLQDVTYFSQYIMVIETIFSESASDFNHRVMCSNQFALGW